jgi:hypothetical protein
MMDLTQIGLLKPAAKNSAPPSKKSSSYTTLFWHPTGPLIAYSKGILHIEDLNPQLSTKWRMSRAEMFKLGWRCIRAAITTPVR